ncbi:hypothetical protein ACTNCE_11630 [Dorea longicatena]|uniref:hypothetical protein n=1 Tax=Dorea longicatena TaxID=88431 RepID=UPI003F88CEB1
MKLRIKKLNSNEIIYFMSYGLYLFFTILNTSFYAKYFDGMLYKMALIICTSILIINEIIKINYSVKKMMGLFIVVLLFGIILHVSSGTEGFAFALLVIYIYCGSDIEFRRIAIFTLLFSALIVSFVVISAQYGIILNYISYNGVSGRIREYMGFRYALFPATYMFNITALVIYVFKDKLNVGMIAVLIGINYYFYIKTNSRITFLLSIFLLIFTILGKKIFIYLFERKVIGIICIFSYIISTVVSFEITKKYNSSIAWMWRLNTFLGDRLRLGQISLRKYGFTILGSKITWVGNGLDTSGNKMSGTYTWVDSLYIQMLQHYGLLFLILFLFLITFALYKIYKDQEYYLLIILVAIAFHSIIDDLSLYLYYNTFWIPVGFYLIESTEVRKDNRKTHFKRKKIY